MRAILMVLVMPFVCPAAGLSGVWSLNGTACATAVPAPLAVQIEQTAGHLRAWLVTTDGTNKHVERVPLDTAEIRSTRDGTEIRVRGATWVITRSGQLIIDGRGARFVLAPARGILK